MSRLTLPTAADARLCLCLVTAAVSHRFEDFFRFSYQHAVLKAYEDNEDDVDGGVAATLQERKP